MAQGKKTSKAQDPFLSEEDLTSLTIGGLPGPGRWLVFTFAPVALFSLKTSQATSTVGRTLVLPTPYSIKTALLDAALRSGRISSESQGDEFVRALASTVLRIGVPDCAMVTHTIVKVRQEPKQPKPETPYIANVAYREFVHFRGEWKIALDLTTNSERTANLVAGLMPLVSYFGKRASFVQYLRAERAERLPQSFTAPLQEMEIIPLGAHVATLDDYGLDVSFDALNSYSKTPIKRDKQRRFVKTVVPLALVRSGPGFSEYRFMES